MSHQPLPHRRVLAATLTALALLLAGCSAEPRHASGPAERPSPTPEPTEEAEPVRWSLTGIEYEEDELPERPAVSVKIENSAQARPQTGLEDADVVYEEMVDGGITRFNAVYHSTVPETVGPVRSIRPMDPPISGPFGGLLVISGGHYVDRAREAGLQVLSFDLADPGLARAGDRPAPHNVYGTFQDFLDNADDGHEPPPEDLLTFAEEAGEATAVAEGSRAEELALGFPAANPGWQWDPEATVRDGEPGAWRRLEGGEPQTSADGEPIRATNVVVLRMDVVHDGNTPETIVTGEGGGVAFSGGHAVEIGWSKGGDEEPLELTRDGEPLELAPGSTWIELLPTEGTLDY